MIQFVTKNFAVLLVFGLAFFAFAGDNFKNIFSWKSDAENKDTNDATLDQTQAQLVAEELYNAMDNAYGTNEAKIWSAFRKMKNRSDFNAVYNEFGKRQYSTINGGIGGPWDPNLNLIVWLENELTADEMRKLRNDFSKLGL